MKQAKQVRDEGLDKFYTNSDCSLKCIDITNNIYKENQWDLIVEPSAGNGSFFSQIKSTNKIGLDIQPEHPDIIKKDFFDYKPDSNFKNILVIGNPPFGKISSLAIQFFNHAANWATVIAFIIPRTFRKTSVQNKLHPYFHLIHDTELPTKPCCFTPEMMVKCCFQVWECRDTKRIITPLVTVCNDWEFLKLGPKDSANQPTPPQNADFALRAYGGKIGEIKITELQLLRPKSWHWFKAKIDKKELISRLNRLDYSCSLNTARQNSMGKAELVALYNNVFYPENK